MQFTPTWPSDAAFDCLATQMGALRKGDPIDGVSSIVSCLNMAPDEARGLLAGIWWDHLDLSSCPSHLHAHEVAQRAKLGSFTLRDPSWRTPSKGRSLEGKFRRFYERHCTQISPRSAQYADAQLRRWISRSSLRSVSALDAAVSFDHRSARGMPWMVTTPRAPLCYLNEAEALLADGLRLEHARSYPGVGGTRGQAQGPGQYASWRAIFGMSLVTNILKKMLYIPLRDRLVGTTKFCAWRSREAVDLAVTNILKSENRGPILSVDFSNFDASIPDEVLDRMFDTLVFWFHGSDTQLVRFCQEAFQRTGLYTPDRYYPASEKRGGVPSGSVLTNLIDSMVNFWAVTYAAHRLGREVGHYLLQGDDGVYTFEGQVNFGDLSDILLVELGMVMSPAKCLVSDSEVVYLQSTHSTESQIEHVCVGIRPISRFLGGYMKPFPLETDPEWGAVLTAIRTLQQLDNCSGHPRFEQALLLAWEHDYENLYDAVVRLCNNDSDLLARASVVRSLRAGGISTTVDDLYKSPSVVALRRLFPKVFSA